MKSRPISPLVLRQRLSELIEEVREEPVALVVEHARQPAAVLLGYERCVGLLAEAVAALPPDAPARAGLTELLAGLREPQKPQE